MVLPQDHGTTRSLPLSISTNVRQRRFCWVASERQQTAAVSSTLQVKILNTDVRDHGSLVPDSHIGNVFALGQFCDVTKVAITSGICSQFWLQANIKIHKIKRRLIFLATLLETM